MRKRKLSIVEKKEHENLNRELLKKITIYEIYCSIRTKIAERNEEEIILVI